MANTPAAEFGARIDRLPATGHIWRIITLISLGGCFEFYDLFLTAYVVPGMDRDKLFTPESLGVFGGLSGLKVQGAGTFVFALFAGLFVGTILFGWVSDHYGRRRVFTISLVWYSVCTLIMAAMPNGFWIDIWRFIAGIGIGVELVTIDTYVSELIPRAHRGKAFAYSQFVTFCAVPVVAFIAWLLGADNWRWVVVIGSLGAVVVWWLRLGLPESPRWLARHGRLAEAEVVVARIEAEVEREYGRSLPAPGEAIEEVGDASFAEMWKPPYGRRTVVMSIFNFFQTYGYYGFAAWVPTLLIAKGITVTRSLEYAFIIAVANPIGPLLGMLIADRIERKWQIVLGALGIAVFGLLFAGRTTEAGLIIFGVLITLSNNLLSFAFHNYQAELFPTRIRSRAVGFVYAWSRLSAALSGLAIAFFLGVGGTPAVFVFIAACMVIVMLVIGLFGPRTRGLALEAISH
ncbi:MAG TPA: MFS transporter [Acetobacteraceae bacterium]|nr:MFS transporter [Acetobacteraceae bacterium]